jgi:hypothetical protein
MRTLAFLLLLLCPTAALAMPPPEVESPLYGRHHLAVELQAGAGTPLGVGGLALSVDLRKQIALEAGAGWSVDGPQAALMTRFRRVTGPWGAGLGVGGSVGPYKHGWDDVDPLTGKANNVHQEASWHPGWWINVEGFTEWRGLSGWRVRGGAGFAWLLNRAGCVGTDVEACGRMPTVGAFFAGMAVGWGR